MTPAEKRMMVAIHAALDEIREEALGGSEDWKVTFVARYVGSKKLRDADVLISSDGDLEAVKDVIDELGARPPTYKPEKH